MPMDPIFEPRATITLMVPPEMADALAVAAREERMSRNSLLTRIVEEWLRERAEPEPAAAEARA